MADTSTQTADPGTAATAGQTSTATSSTTVEFRNIPLSLIVIEKQIRTGADVDDEAAQGLKDSIAAKGVLEPILVTPRADKYLLLAGERRYRACQQLGLETIPACILPDVQSGEDVLTIQLIENLQRQEIDPIDKANAILAFFQNRHEGMELEAVFSALLNFDRDPQRVKSEITETVSVISKYVGMTTRTIENLLSLLTLPQEIGDAVKTGAVPVSQGYILAANLKNPGLMAVFESILTNPVTNKKLAELLKKAGQADPPATAEPASPFRPVYTAAQKLANCLENGEFRYDLIELENLRLFFPLHDRGDRKGQGGRRNGKGARAFAGGEGLLTEADSRGNALEVRTGAHLRCSMADG